jgi:hypothetical protein
MGILEIVYWIFHINKCIINKIFRLLFMLALGLLNFVNSRSSDRIIERYNLIRPVYSTNERRDEKLKSKNSRGEKKGHFEDGSFKVEENEKSSKEKIQVNLNLDDENENERIDTRASDIITPTSTKHSLFFAESQEHLKSPEKLNRFTNKYQSSLNLPLKSDMITLAEERDLSQEEISKILPHNFLESIFINYIISQRMKAFQIVKKFMKLKIYRKKIKIYYLLKKILRERRAALIKIQKNVRRFIVSSNINRVLRMMNKNYAIFYYKIKIAKEIINIRNVKIIFEETKGTWTTCRIYSMEFNKYLNCFILYIKKLDYAKRKYKFNFIVNTKVMVDMNFETFSSPEGKFYNILDMTLLKNKGYLSNINEKNDYHGIYNPGRKLSMPILNYPNLKLSKNKIEIFSDDDYIVFRRKKIENLVVSY